MLEDTQRKILRVLYHLYQQQWVRPDIARVSQFSLRSEERVREAIKALRAAGYVEIPEGKMRIIRPGEPEIERPQQPVAPAKSAYSMEGWFE
jgi:SOS-response transcriptional repressor LexA